jgi:hypothetical protein
MILKNKTMLEAIFNFFEGNCSDQYSHQARLQVAIQASKANKTTWTGISCSLEFGLLQ